MPNPLSFDVFLSHSSKDKAVAGALAERLRTAGLRVWFEDWELKPADSISAKTEAGLEQSRVLILCISENAFGSEWPQLEAETLPFRDPLNKVRRFVRLRLDEAPIKSSLAPFPYITWLPSDRERHVAKVVDACRRPVITMTVGQKLETLPIADKSADHKAHLTRMLTDTTVESLL